MISLPAIQTLAVTHLIGHSLTMSLINNKTADLWRGFMPRRREIINAVGTALYSVNIYSDSYFASFNPAAEFEKWAAVPVTDFGNVPDGMDTLTIPEGQYAVFHYKGAPENGAQVFGYIFQQWLPQSGYQLITVRILKCWGKSIKMEAMRARRRYGYRSGSRFQISDFRFQIRMLGILIK